jgi:hypothetical protein
MLCPRESAPGIHWIGGWVDPRASLDYVEKRQFLTLPGLELQPVGCPAHSQSLYRLSNPSKTFNNFLIHEWPGKLYLKMNWLFLGRPFIVAKYRTAMKSIQVLNPISTKLTSHIWAHNAYTLYFPEDTIYAVLLKFNEEKNRHLFVKAIWRAPYLVLGHPIHFSPLHFNSNAASVPRYIVIPFH